LPIGEEIVSRHGDAVITRNSYGALGLNTPDTVFADVDVDEGGPGWLYWLYLLPIAAVGVYFSREFETARARIEKFATVRGQITPLCVMPVRGNTGFRAR
jgi:hypothetical protein